jgi:membrane-bound lytic murein transglycosylase D
MKNFFIIIVILTIHLLLIQNSYANGFEYNWTSKNDQIFRYANLNREHLVRQSESYYYRGLKYRNYIEKMAKKYDVPREIFALAAIESAFDPHAKSHANAVGMWQFLSGTAKDMGLNIGNGRDERHNWKKSTGAAMKYIKWLADEHFMGDYELAVLAYNAGPNRVKRAIVKNQTADVWKLIKDRKTFPKESREYLPKFISFVHLFAHMDEKYRQQLAMIK